MPKSSLTFDLDNPDDRLSFRRAVAADDLTFALCDISQALRNKVKYAPDGRERETAALEQFREEFFEVLALRGIDLDQL